MCLLAVRFFYQFVHSFCLPEMTEDNLFRSHHTGMAESGTPRGTQRLAVTGQVGDGRDPEAS